jgi:tRNA 2-thiocytidine biosynthesis protein TtcA
MLREWEKRHPGRVESIARALANVAPSHLLDRALFDFAAVAATGRADPAGDRAFDPERLPSAPRPSATDDD